MCNGVCMIVYSGSKASFQRDLINGVIAEKIEDMFISFGIPKESRAEYRSWENSLPKIGMIISNRKIADEVQVALEYQIPLTSKRVDFMIGADDLNVYGIDAEGNETPVFVNGQWAWE